MRNAITLTALSALMLTTAAAPSAAQSWTDGVYIRLFGGGSFLRDDTATLSGVGSGSVSFDPGFALGGALGYEVTRNISAEIELAYRSSSVSSFGNPALGTGGDYASLAVMANVTYQLDGWNVGLGRRLRPFAGVGLGVIEEIDFDLKGGTGPREFSDSGRLAFQVRSGLNWELTRNWVVSSEVRYFSAGTPKLAGQAGRTLEAGYASVDVLLGLAYRF
jgi:opacity protein-like surface antigen